MTKAVIFDWGFIDADGRHPRHTFFFPIEQYKAEYLDALAGLTGLGLGEVEVHLHHDGDTAAHLREELEGFTTTLHARHGLVSKDPSGGHPLRLHTRQLGARQFLARRAMVRGRDELDVLRRTGCYADYTLPSAPSPAQTRTVNQVYYADTARAVPKSHDRGRRASVGRRPASTDLLLVQGPLAVSWWHAKRGIIPRLESGTLDARNPPTVARFADWLWCVIVYLAEAVGGELKAGDDADEVAFFPADDLPALAFRATRQAVERWADGRRSML